MISDTTVDRYYYIFDSRAHRALVMDRRTGEEVAWSAAPRVQLIEYVAGEHGTPILRRFAQWCARQAGAAGVPDDTPTGRLWAAARGGDRDTWQHVRTDETDAVVEASALGLSRRQARAARLLAAHACTHPDDRQAAIDAAHMSERWAEFVADGDAAQAVEAMRQRQIDWLLDVLGEGGEPDD
jgi:hypothetical protein